MAAEVTGDAAADGSRRDRRPVLVTGLPRSGTTWVGETLARSPEAHLVYEPFNPASVRDRWFDPGPFYRHLDGSGAELHRPVEDMLALRYPLARRLADDRGRHARAAVATWRRARRGRGRTVLLKDPVALFAAPWLHDAFGVRPVVLVRHPGGFVSSVLRMGWRVRFQDWLGQPGLVDGMLAPWREELERAAARPDPARDAALFWKVEAATILRWRDAEHPAWTYLRHEDLCADPPGAFAALFRTLGLEPPAGLAAHLLDASGPANPAEARPGRQHDLRRDSAAQVAIWRDRLDADVTAMIEAVTADVADAWYGSRAWG